MNDTQPPQEVRIEITWKSVMRVLVGVLLGFAAVRLWPFLKVVVLAILIAVAFYPAAAWVHRKGAPRWVGALAASVILLAVLLGCFAVVGPLVLHQAGKLSENLPKLREQLLAQLPPSWPLRQALESGMSAGTVADSRLMLQRLITVVATTAHGLFDLLVVVVLALYLIADGARALKWLIVFFPQQERQKISLALTEIGQLIFAYVAGQCLVSAMAAAYLFIVLTFLKVPMALLLGIIAGICDIVPIIGFCVAVSLAMVMGLTVSPTTALLVLALYGGYHLFENFFIVPKVYGRRLRLAKLAVPLAIAAGGLIAGVVGAITVLPLVAAYPVVERLWLAPKLEPDTVKAHEEREYRLTPPD
jgi:predicted PurR-regulated permease PerM